MERLLGAARLLSEMVEPIFKAATQYYTTNQQPSLINFWWVTHSRKEKRSYGPSLCGPSFGVFGWKETIWSSTIKRSLLSEISTLLARRFFTGFCFMILALLARIRVLVQQILIDVVSVFNMVSSISQKKHTVTINQEGIQVFREFYPTNEEFVFLQCVWKEDKFVLQETKQNFESRNWQENLGPSVSLSTSAIQYTSIESFLEDDESAIKQAEVNQSIEGLDLMKMSKKNDLLASLSKKDNTATKDGSVCPTETSSKTLLPQEGSLLVNSSPTSVGAEKSDTKRPAFVSVKNPNPISCSAVGIQFNETKVDSEEKEDPFFTLLTDGEAKSSLF
ncbi:uncharacterized protein LOC111023972 isoform X3 [Momordica charantia]|nr:uncharacterized protein LOC111023972 isoform X3 [Momordica charantia]XP_022157205.1 uncharacterized protein LOC111023972 isoform X3 [Momordica charantia]